MRSSLSYMMIRQLTMFRIKSDSNYSSNLDPRIDVGFILSIFSLRNSYTVNVTA